MKPLKNSPIVLFDGYCNLCNASVQYLIKHDGKKHFLLTSLQSDAATKILLQFGQKSFKDFNSIVLINEGVIYKKSSAALHIARQLSGLIKLVYIFIIVPKPLRDFIYDYIAKNRYKWFGKKQDCMLPNPDDIDRFL